MLCITNKRISSTLFKWKLFYLSVVEDSSEIIKEETLRGRFIAPLVSSSTFKSFYGKYCESTDVGVASTDDKWLEIILSERKGYLPTLDDKDSFLINESDYKEALSKVSSGNASLEAAGRLLEEEEIRPSLKYLYTESIKKITQDDYDEGRWLSIKEKKIDTVTFYQLVNADFIISANPYYPKESIKEFIESELLKDE